jgi:hypothetical protein
VSMRYGQAIPIEGINMTKGSWSRGSPVPNCLWELLPSITKRQQVLHQLFGDWQSLRVEALNLVHAGVGFLVRPRTKPAHDLGEFALTYPAARPVSALVVCLQQP